MIKLLAWYEGPPVQIGHTFDKENVVIYLIKENSERIRLHYNDSKVIMDTYNIVSEGNNWHSVSYLEDEGIITAQYSVPGVKEEDKENPEFKVLYINKDSIPGIPETVDLTEEFEPYFTYGKELVITWSEFLNCVDYLANKKGTPYFGLFHMTAPKNTGLYCKYASAWNVFCSDEHTIKAEIYKVYTKKEDKQYGTEKEN